MEKDVVCGMEINRREAGAQAQYQGQDYYFCGPGCKERFERNPERYVKKAAQPT